MITALPSWPHTLGRYARLYLALMRNNLVRDLEFKQNAVVLWLTHVILTLLYLVGFLVYYRFVPVVAGWGIHEMLFFNGVLHLIDGFWMFTSFFNLLDFPDKVNSGELDTYLVKPVNTRFLLSLRRVSYASLGDMALGAIFIAIAWPHLRPAVPVNAWRILVFGALAFNGVLIFYGLTFIIVTTAILSVKLNAVNRAQTAFEFSVWPDGIYQGWLRTLLLTALPMLLIVNFPTRFLLGTLDWPWVLYSLAIGVGLVLLGEVYWRWAIRRYAGAGS